MFDFKSRIDCILLIIIIIFYPREINAQTLYEYGHQQYVVQQLRMCSVSIAKTTRYDTLCYNPKILGSGFLVTNDREILVVTDNHVINDIKLEEKILIGLNRRHGDLPPFYVPT
jgi:hypothetical protein